MTYFCITINAHPHSGWFCVKHYLISLKRNSIALHRLKPHIKTSTHRTNPAYSLIFSYLLNNRHRHISVFRDDTADTIAEQAFQNSHASAAQHDTVTFLLICRTQDAFGNIVVVFQQIGTVDVFAAENRMCGIKHLITHLSIQAVASKFHNMLFHSAGNHRHNYQRATRIAYKLTGIFQCSPRMLRTVNRYKNAFQHFILQSAQVHLHIEQP